jgi:hypothetical protein
VLTDNRHGLAVNVHASTATAYAERDVVATMLGEVPRSHRHLMVGADKGDDTCGLVMACRNIKVSPSCCAQHAPHRR